MQLPHLFEFMDQAWLPDSLRSTIRECLECGSSRPFQDYYEWVANEVRREVLAGGFEHVVELGAGTAPIARHLARLPDLAQVEVIVCDSHPQTETYRDLEKQFPDRIRPLYEPVDFTQPRAWPPKTLLLLAAAFHHIPPAMRRDVLRHLSESGARVMVVEPVRKTALSMLFCGMALTTSFLLPFWFFRRPGKLRRFFWCYLFPVAPFVFLWEGLVSCLRMWSDAEWKANLGAVLSPERGYSIQQSRFRQLVVW
jgi:hypothetical protein